ncbi:MAG: hypothetical protein ACXAD7_01375 [Candidatus Kariarchaeaceae archaeon]
MKFSTLFTILLIASSLLLFPIFENEETIDVFPFTKKSVVKNIHHANIRITTNINVTVLINITLLKPNIDSSTIKWQGDLDEKLNVHFDEPGFYRFEFLSEKIGKITIEGEGLTSTSLLIVSFFIFIRLLIFIRQRYFAPIEGFDDEVLDVDLDGKANFDTEGALSSEDEDPNKVV